MSGYFSRIARQSGARFQSEGAHPHLPTTEGGDRGVVPLEHEVVVMTPPAEQPKAGMRERTSEMVEAGSVNRSGEAPAREQTDEVSGPTSQNIVSRTAIKTVPAGDEVRYVEPDPVVQSRSRARNATNAIGPDAPEPSKSVRKPPSGRMADKPPGSDRTDFFQKTSAIIEGKDDAAPAEVQTILLKEVQDWIAAGQISEGISDETVVADGHAAAGEPLSEAIRKPGVVRIVETARRETPSEASRRSSAEPAIKEQTVEISIGSISVVVEGEDPPASPAPAIVTERHNATETSRRTSRLSRHYL